MAPESALDRAARRWRRLSLVGASFTALLIAATIVYQLRFDTDPRHIEVRVFEVTSGQDGSMAFRHCLSGDTRVSVLRTTGVYLVSLETTRPAASRLIECISANAGVEHARLADGAGS